MAKLQVFSKEGCSACTMVENFLNDQGVVTEKVNPFSDPKLATKHGVSSVPVTILLDDEGNELQKSIGFKPAQLEEMISKL